MKEWYIFEKKKNLEFIHLLRLLKPLFCYFPSSDEQDEKENLIVDLPVQLLLPAHYLRAPIMRGPTLEFHSCLVHQMEEREPVSET